MAVGECSGEPLRCDVRRARRPSECVHGHGRRELSAPAARARHRGAYAAPIESPEPGGHAPVGDHVGATREPERGAGREHDCDAGDAEPLHPRGERCDVHDQRAGNSECAGDGEAHVGRRRRTATGHCGVQTVAIGEREGRAAAPQGVQPGEGQERRRRRATRDSAHRSGRRWSTQVAPAATAQNKSVIAMPLKITRSVPVGRHVGEGVRVPVAHERAPDGGGDHVDHREEHGPRRDPRRRETSRAEQEPAGDGDDRHHRVLQLVGDLFPGVEVEQMTQRDVEDDERDRDGHDAHEPEHREHGRGDLRTEGQQEARDADDHVRLDGEVPEHVEHACSSGVEVPAGVVGCVHARDDELDDHEHERHREPGSCPLLRHPPTLRQNGAPGARFRARGPDHCGPPTPGRARRRRPGSRRCRAPAGHPRGCCSSHGCTPRRGARRWG